MNKYKRTEIMYIALFSSDIEEELEEDYISYRELRFRKNPKGNVIISGNKDVLLEFLLDRSDEVFKKQLAFHKHKKCFN